MALEEVSFYNMVGDEIKITNLVDQMIDYYVQKYEVGETVITDFNQGSEIRNLLETFAVGIYALLEDVNEASKLPFISSSYDEWLDRIGENPFIALPRIQGNEATGTVKFTLISEQDSDYIIPGGTILVDSETGLEFLTDSDCLISVGETIGEINATCLTTGYDGNSEPDKITIISSENTDLDLNLVSVTNLESFENGTDYEDDDDYRERLLANVRADGFGTLGYYKSLAESVTGVHDVKLIDSQFYTKTVLVNGDSKPTSDSVLLNVLAQLTDLDNIVLNHNFNVNRATPQEVDLNVVLTVTAYLNDTTLTEHLTAFFDGGSTPYEYEYEGLKIDESIEKNDIVTVFKLIDAIADVEVYETGESEPLTEIECTENKVLKLGTLTITQNKV